MPRMGRGHAFRKQHLLRARAQGQHFSDDSYNEIITLQDDDGLYFSATMAMGFGSFEKEFDVKRMTAETMAAYLWDRFASQLR